MWPSQIAGQAGQVAASSVVWQPHPTYLWLIAILCTQTITHITRTLSSLCRKNGVSGQEMVLSMYLWWLCRNLVKTWIMQTSWTKLQSAQEVIVFHTQCYQDGRAKQYSRLQKSCNMQAEQWKTTIDLLHMNLIIFPPQRALPLCSSTINQLRFSTVQLACCKTFAICCNSFLSTQLYYGQELMSSVKWSISSFLVPCTWTMSAAFVITTQVK